MMQVQLISQLVLLREKILYLLLWEFPILRSGGIHKSRDQSWSIIYSVYNHSLSLLVKKSTSNFQNPWQIQEVLTLREFCVHGNLHKMNFCVKWINSKKQSKIHFTWILILISILIPQLTRKFRTNDMLSYTYLLYFTNNFISDKFILYELFF